MVLGPVYSSDSRRPDSIHERPTASRSDLSNSITINIVFFDWVLADEKIPASPSRFFEFVSKL